MKKDQVKIGGRYQALVSGRLVTVVVVAAHPRGGYDVENLRTGRRLRFRSAARLRTEVAHA